tara:strand:- start:2576 stop:3529 length:954 start_codon:yes stop_codon:yes gene_type:complete
MVGKLTRDDIPTASISPYLFNEYKYGSRNEALKRCIDAKHGKPTRFEQTNIQRTGDVLEPVLITEACERLGMTDIQTNIDNVSKHDFLLFEASLDGMAHADNLVIKEDRSRGIYLPEATEVKLDGQGVVECKCTRDYAEDTPALWRGVLQMQAQMECAGVDWGLLVVLYQSTDLRMFVYKRDPSFAVRLKRAVEDWNRRVQEEDYFPFEILDESRNDGVLVHPEATEEEVIDLDMLCEDHARQIMLSDVAIKNAKENKQRATAALMEAMGNHSKAKAGDFAINWGMTHFKAKEEKVVPAKEAYSVRRKTLSIKRVSE